ncbi:conserved hypothetical protein [Candida albicans WO-1]|uniref:Secreted protein n=1 Tax=Candida albicans (strain WO-1) TaxID=294748 RepID=C4YMN1_CANAW|nr:conserved hypothetical protein [Candida albicans WO-1]
MVLCGFFFLFSMEPSSDFQQNSEPTRVTLVRAFFFLLPSVRESQTLYVCSVNPPPLPPRPIPSDIKPLHHHPSLNPQVFFISLFFFFFSTSIHY